MLKPMRTSLLAALLLCFPFAAGAAVDCGPQFHEAALKNGLKINQAHVFCGEWKNNAPKGFHSRPKGENPATVKQFRVQDKPNAAGIYTGKWIHADSAGQEKFSTMFPDSCSSEQVLNSIAYAAAHQEPCPSGAPSWSRCGKNRPETAGKDRTDYCGSSSPRFVIAFAPPQGGLINTAFPIR